MKTRAILILAASLVVSTIFAAPAPTPPPSTPGSIVTKTADYVCVPTNRLIIVNASANSVQITLPTANASGQSMEVLVINGTYGVTVVAGGTNVVIDPSGGTKMGGQAYSTCAGGEAVEMESDGLGTWYVIMARNNACSNWVNAAPPATATAQVPPGTGSGQLIFWDDVLKKWVVTDGSLVPGHTPPDNPFPASITTSGSVGLEVHVTQENGLNLTSATHFVDFYDGNTAIRGSIQGQNLGDLTSDPGYQAQMKINDMNIATAGIGAGIATADLASSIAHNIAEDIPAVCEGACVAVCGGVVEKPSEIVWTVAEIVIKGVNETNALLTVVNAKAGEDAYVHSVKDNIGVTYSSAAADYAEWLPKLVPEEKFAPGQIVGIHEGKISKNTDGSSKLMVISSVPIVLGNTPPTGKEKEYEKVAFMGQVPVVVSGPVHRGDYILPNGLNAGRGVAVSPDKMKVADYKTIVGISWSASEDKNPKSVNVAVGLNTTAINSVMESQDAVIQSQAMEIKELRASIGSTHAVLAKLVPGFKDAMGSSLSSGSIPKPANVSPVPPAAQDRSGMNMSTAMPLPKFRPVSDADLQNGISLGLKICKDAGQNFEKNSYLKKLTTDAGFREEESARIKAKINTCLETYGELLSRRSDDSGTTK